jgi:hypothetical protein
MSKVEEAKQLWRKIVSKEPDIFNYAINRINLLDEIKTSLDLQFIVTDQVGVVYGLPCNTNKLHIIIHGGDVELFFENKKAAENLTLLYFTKEIDGRCFKRFDDIFGIRINKWNFAVMDITEPEVINPGDQQKVDLFIFIDHDSEVHCETPDHDVAYLYPTEQMNNAIQTLIGFMRHWIRYIQIYPEILYPEIRRTKDFHKDIIKTLNLKIKICPKCDQSSYCTGETHLCKSGKMEKFSK